MGKIVQFAKKFAGKARESANEAAAARREMPRQLLHSQFSRILERMPGHKVSVDGKARLTYIPKSLKVARSYKGPAYSLTYKAPKGALIATIFGGKYKPKAGRPSFPSAILQELELSLPIVRDPLHLKQIRNIYETLRDLSFSVKVTDPSRKKVIFEKWQKNQERHFRENPHIYDFGNKE